MTTPRRRLVRQPPQSRANGLMPAAQLSKLRTKLADEQVILTRWLRRLKRAFHAFEKSMSQVHRIQHQLVRLDRDGQGRSPS